VVPILVAAGFAVALAAAPRDPDASGERRFEFSYRATLPALPKAARKVRIWIPLPSSGPHQVIADLRVHGPGKPAIDEEPAHRNRMAYFEVSEPGGAPISVSVAFTATRHENRVDLAAVRALLPDSSLERYLLPDRLAPIDEEIRERAAAATGSRSTALDKARAIFDAVLEHMTYDKSGTGWGRGDAKYACTAGRGNCTDYHALFIAMCRASSIPTRFAMGFSIPADRKEGSIGGYHCWSYFFSPEHGWVPVDASEADKHPDKRDYFFGAHDADRIEFSEGRDLRLVPPQDGEPLNYFIHPYVEVDGAPIDVPEKSFTFREVQPAGEKQ
jgi:transglutaminase-like putative cysteine protease